MNYNAQCSHCRDEFNKKDMIFCETMNSYFCIPCDDDTQSWRDKIKKTKGN